MARGVKLTRSEPVFVQDPLRNDGWRIVITATEGELMPVEIFLNLLGVLNARTQVTTNEFVGIASPVDLTTVPVDTPATGASPPLFRSDKIDALVPSSALAEELWLLVVQEVNHLIEALNRLDRIDEVETVQCGESASESSGG